MKKLTTLVLISFFFGKSFAQFNLVWDAQYQHSASLNYSNESRKVVVDASGNVFVLADVTSDIDPFGIFTTNTYDYTIVLKYSSSGTLLNSDQIYVGDHYTIGFDNYGAFGLELDAAGDVYIGFTTFSAFNSFDVNIVKYDNNLTQIWYYQFKPTSEDLGIDLKVSSSGLAYALVKSTSGSDTTFNILSANSSLVTVTPFYSFNVNADFLSRLTLDGNQNVYVTGYKQVGGFKSILTARVNAAGNLAWQSVFNGGSANRDDMGSNLNIGVDGKLYVTGTSDRGAPTNNDVVLIKHAVGNGKIYWTKFFDYNSGNDQGCFVYSPNVNYVYVGSVSSNNVLIDRVEAFSGNSSNKAVYQPNPVEPHNAINAVSLVDFKISPNLNFYITGTVIATDLNGQTFSAYYLAKFIISTNARNGFKLDFENPVTGDFNQSFSASSLALDNLNEDVYWLGDVYLDYSNHQIEEIFLMDFDVPIPFKNENEGEGTFNPDDDILIYPALAQNFVSVNSASTISRIELFDMAGKKVKAITCEMNNNKIEINNLAPGVYIVRIYSDTDKITSRKIIKN